MKVHGRCLCGQVRYRAEVDPTRVFVCHCTDCQIQSGTSFRTTVLTEPDSFELESGEIRHFEKTAASGRKRSLGFCPECGTAIYGGPGAESSGLLSLRLGPLAERYALIPVAEAWCRSAQPWLDRLGELPRFDQQPG